jgi:hypothetical protein
MRVVTQAWNPQKLGGFANSISGRGLAMYWLDESGLVHLWFRPKYGSEEHYAGPLPEALQHGSSSSRRVRKQFRLVVGGYVVLTMTGFLTGYFVTNGSAVHRLIAAGIGVGIGMVLFWLLSLIFSVGSSVRSLFRREPPR